MTVKELIVYLGKMNQDAVVVRGDSDHSFVRVSCFPSKAEATKRPGRPDRLTEIDDPTREDAVDVVVID